MNVLDTRTVIPSMIRSTKKNDGVFRKYPVTLQEEDAFYAVTYSVPVHNHTGNTGKTRNFTYTLPKQIFLTEEAFEVFGILQGEMSKTHRGPLTICNSEPSMMKKVLRWFEGCASFPVSSWKWYIRMNIPPVSKDCGDQLTSELVEFWMNQCNISYQQRYPKTITYTPKSRNLVATNEGSLIIETRGTIFVQFVQSLIYHISQSIGNYDRDLISAYMRGIIAAEGCINYKLQTGHRRVFISASKQKERDIFIACLEKLGIESYDCKAISDIVISRKKNLLRMHELGLVSLHPDKHDRFLEMLNSYQR